MIQDGVEGKSDGEAQEPERNRVFAKASQTKQCPWQVKLLSTTYAALRNVATSS